MSLNALSTHDLYNRLVSSTVYCSIKALNDLASIKAYLAESTSVIFKLFQKMNNKKNQLDFDGKMSEYLHDYL